MKKSIVFIYILSFFIFFLYTFPSDKIIAYYLKKNGILYSDIEGDFFKLYIKNVKYGVFFVKNITIKNYIVFMNFYINGVNVMTVRPFSKEVKLYFDNFDISTVSTKVKGKITGKHVVKVLKRDFSITGKGNLFIEIYPEFMIKNIHVYYNMTRDKVNKLEADIESGTVRGTFLGELFIPISLKNGYLKGFFEGELFGRTIKQKIYIGF